MTYIVKNSGVAGDGVSAGTRTRATYETRVRERRNRGGRRRHGRRAAGARGKDKEVDRSAAAMKRGQSGSATCPSGEGGIVEKQPMTRGKHRGRSRREMGRPDYGRAARLSDSAVMFATDLPHVWARTWAWVCYRIGRNNVPGVLLPVETTAAILHKAVRWRYPTSTGGFSEGSRHSY